MGLRRPRMKGTSRLLRSVYPGDCHQKSRQAVCSTSLSTTPTSAVEQIFTGISGRGCLTHRYSAMVEASQLSCPEINLLSFIKSTLDDLEGPYHSWLNRVEKSRDFSRGEETFLVVAACFLDCESIFEKVKTLQQRFPQLRVMGFHPISSPTDEAHVIKLFMMEYFTFPILLSKTTFPELEHGLCCILFRNFRNPVYYNEKELDQEIVSKVIEELHEQPHVDSTLLNTFGKISWKSIEITKEPYMCTSLQNLLLHHPGCVSSDEIGNRIFISDCNHHRIIISDGNGNILDCIGCSPGFEDGDFESAKLMRPAGSFYHTDEDCLYFVDSENHAIRKADLETRTVETLYPTNSTNKRSMSMWTWVMNKLGFESSGVSDHDKKPEESNASSLFLPWHIILLPDDSVLIINRRFQTLWIMDLASGKIRDLVKGSPNVLEICRDQIEQKLSLLKQIPHDWLQQKNNTTFQPEGLPHAELLSSLTTLKNHIILSDTVGQRILKVSCESGISSNFQFSNFGVLGLPYWLTTPLERVCAFENGQRGAQVDHSQLFQLLPGRIDIRLNVDIPEDTKLVEPLQEACIWRQARGSANEISGILNGAESSEKVGVAQQWYDELDNLAFQPESDITDEDGNLQKDLKEQDGRVHINCAVNTSPGTSEVIVYAAMYLKLIGDSGSQEQRQDKYAERIVDIVSSGRCRKMERDLWTGFLLKSDMDLRDLIFMRPLHVRVKLDTLDHPKAHNSKDIILTDSSIEVNVSLSP